MDIEDQIYYTFFENIMIWCEQYMSRYQQELSRHIALGTNRRRHIDIQSGIFIRTIQLS